MQIYMSYKLYCTNWNTVHIVQPSLDMKRTKALIKNFFVYKSKIDNNYCELLSPWTIQKIKDNFLIYPRLMGSHTQCHNNGQYQTYFDFSELIVSLLYNIRKDWLKLRIEKIRTSVWDTRIVYKIATKFSLNYFGVIKFILNFPNNALTWCALSYNRTITYALIEKFSRSNKHNTIEADFWQAKYMYVYFIDRGWSTMLRHKISTNNFLVQTLATVMQLGILHIIYSPSYTHV